MWLFCQKFAIIIEVLPDQKILLKSLYTFRWVKMMFNANLWLMETIPFHLVSSFGWPIQQRRRLQVGKHWKHDQRKASYGSRKMKSGGRWIRFQHLHLSIGNVNNIIVFSGNSYLHTTRYFRTFPIVFSFKKVKSTWTISVK